LGAKAARWGQGRTIAAAHAQFDRGKAELIRTAPRKGVTR
jgi:hypothetical protein